MAKGQDRILLLLACGILVLALGWVFFAGRDREPTYQGSTLSQWLTEEKPIDASSAVRAIGTNAIPISLQWISYEASPLRDTIASLVGRLSPGLSRSFISHREQSADHAVAVFSSLGPQARAAIPELTRLAQTSSSSRRAVRCLSALVSLGPDALPSMLTLVTNSPPMTRWFALSTLSAFGTNAQVAIPTLRPLLTDPDPTVRVQATNALLQIAPEVLTNALPE